MNKTITLTLYFLIAAVFVLRFPVARDNFKSEGKVVIPQKIYVVGENNSLSPIVFPAADKKSIAIFWASWCGPCSIELNRINKAILNKEINAENVFAISIDENPEVLFLEIKKRNYAFKIYFDRELILSNQMKVASTPTVAFINKLSVVEWQSTGVSPMLITRINNFLN